MRELTKVKGAFFPLPVGSTSKEVGVSVSLLLRRSIAEMSTGNINARAMLCNAIARRSAILGK